MYFAPQMLIADRFSLAYQVGSGGGGSVYKAFDLLTQKYVAIKFLHGQSESPVIQARFQIEAELLASLHHPGIVSYVAHGHTPGEIVYLALEWLDGEVLATRLRSVPFTIQECVLILRKAAEPLAMVHERDIVHGDLTPNNLFLRDGRLDGVTLIDFGLARYQVSTKISAPFPEDLSGTAGYLAPEVIRGNSQVTKAADIFSLGCIVYECLTASPLFIGSNVTSILAKTLFAEVLSVRQLRPAVSGALDSLVLRMLAQDPKDRPQDAVALLYELTLLGDLECTDSPAISAHSVITSGEERLVTVIVSAPPTPEGAAAAPVSSSSVDHGRLAAMHAALAGLGAQIELLNDGALVIAFPHAASAAALDMVERAVRSSLLLKAQWPAARVAVATGHGQFPQKLPMGEAVERAVQLLTAVPSQGPGTLTNSLLGNAYVLTDELTYRLVGERLDIRPLAEKVFAVYGESQEADHSRPLLGQPTPCVGREPELALLEDTLRICTNQRVARVVIVTGPSGAGKSRLRHEFWRRTQAQGASPTTLLLRGDQMRAGSPFAVVGQALRHLFALNKEDSADNNRGKILSYLAGYGLGSETQRVAEMLGEVCGARFPEEQSPRLVTARHDPRVMMAQVSQAWVDLLGALCTQKPVLLMLEDLHYADALSVALIGSALKELAELPFMVVAMGRPDMSATYPQLWLDREPQIVRLGTLSRKACERLARHVLGPQFPLEIITRIVELCGGNALYLEELIRTAVEDKSLAVPHAVLLIVQARLLRLPSEQRRTLRAASLFGEIFWRGGIVAILGPDYRATALDETLNALIEQELIESQPGGRFSHEQEFRFHHCLVREAALSLLTPGDRTLGHRIAGAYLETVNEGDPMILAEHFRSGEEPARALPYYLAAAEGALTGCDLAGALLCTQQALTCGPSDRVLGAIRGVELAAHFWRDEWVQAADAGTEALHLLATGSAAWCSTAAIMLPITVLSGLHATFSAIATTLGTFAPTADACRAYLQAASYVVITSSLTGQREMAIEFRQRVQRHSAELTVQDLGVVGTIRFGETVYARMLGQDPWQSYQLSVDGGRACQQAGDLRTLLWLKAFEAIGLAELGDPWGAEPILQTAMALATQLHEPLLLTHVRVHIAQLQLLRGDAADLEAAYHSSRQSEETVGINPLLRGQSLINLARALLLRGELAAAEATARIAATILATTPAHLTFLSPVLISSLLQQGRVPEAAAEARAGLLQIARVGSGGYAEIAFLLSAVLALRADGATAEAHATLAQARRQVQRRADCIPNPVLRERFISQVAENRQVMSLEVVPVD